MVEHVIGAVALGLAVVDARPSLPKGIGSNRKQPLHQVPQYARALVLSHQHAGASA